MWEYRWAHTAFCSYVIKTWKMENGTQYGFYYDMRIFYILRPLNIKPMTFKCKEVQGKQSVPV
jgi:hypothetical protein